MDIPQLGYWLVSYNSLELLGFSMKLDFHSLPLSKK